MPIPSKTTPTNLPDKARAHLLLFALTCGTVGFGSIPARSQEPEIDPLTGSSQQLSLNRAGEALDRVILTAKKVNGKLGYGFFEKGCVFGVMLRPGTSASEELALTAGQSYVFIGGGDKSASNVDVLLSDSSGKVVVKDTEKDAAPFVLFKPQRSGRYRMSLRLSSSRSGTAFCAMTVLRKGGYDVPIERIAQALLKAEATTTYVFRGVRGGRLNQDGNTWALYGAVLRPKQSISSTPKLYRPAKRIFIGVGDNSIQDLDLRVLDGGRRSVASDTKNGPGAALAYQTAQANYSVALSNNSSSGPALVMAILMDLPAGFQVPVGGNVPSRPGPVRGNTQYAGSWSGDWIDAGNRQEGELEIVIRANGTLSGRLRNTTLNATTTVTGSIAPNGLLTLNYSYAGQNYVAQGTIRPMNDGEGGVGGQVAFATNGVVFGTANFSLYKDD